MAIVKRKAVAKSGVCAFKGVKGNAVKKDEFQEQPEAEEQVEETMQDVDPEADDAEEEEEVDEAQALAKAEGELLAARRKELKTMPVNDIKECVQKAGLELGKKEDMINDLTQHEADARAKERSRQKELRGIVVKKKEELSGLSVSELRGLCIAGGVKSVMTKQARVELLMKQWQDDDGVDKAVAKKARDAREVALQALDEAGLRKLCNTLGVDPLVKEVMVERVVKRECELGRFAKPQLPVEDEDDGASSAGTKATKKAKDMVDALLANEANRKREKELKKQEEDAAANKRKELKSLSVEDLKKQVSKKGQEPIGKKDDLVEVLFAVWQEEEAAASKKAKLKALSLEHLQQRMVSRCLEPSKKKDAMVESLLQYEVDMIKKCQGYQVKVDEALEKKKEDLEGQTAAELKELCVSKGLRTGVGKQERIELLLEGARVNGEVDKLVAGAIKEARKKDLLAMDTAAVLELCESMSVNPVVKQVAIERLMAHEDDHGPIHVEEEQQGRPAKRARTTGKR
jgi:hypothetical protein